MLAPSSIVINGETALSERNPHTWLVLNGDPPGCEGPRCMTGTLRPVHRGRVNNATELAAAKLLIDVDQAGQP